MTKISDYITPEGFEQLRSEFDYLWRIERPRVTHEVQVAAAHGDRSENAEYKYGKLRLREIDKRLEFLSKRLKQLVVTPAPPDAHGKVVFGAWVRLEDEEGRDVCYQIVGTDEFDVDKGKISVASPMGRALLGKSEGDEISVRRPKGEMVYTILAVNYRERPT